MTEETIRKYTYTKEEVDLLIAAAVEEDGSEEAAEDLTRHPTHHCGAVSSGPWKESEQGDHTLNQEEV